ncbi:MAG TPA: DUF1801 domain-containing protein [Flavitalea sp.]|nr:DUF1801 domain-containing protein [Flavitalea sp.]
MNHTVDFYFDKATSWQKEITELRKVVLDCGLNETLKWGCPCYTLQDKNIVLIHTFKEYCAVLFFKGALLKDTKNILVQQTKNVQSARQVRFVNVKEVIQLKTTLKAYIKQAIAVENAGLKVDFKESRELIIPSELKARFSKSPALKTAFNGLTPGRQRAYVLYFTAPKQTQTRESRIDKYTTQILNGKGLND